MDLYSVVACQTGFPKGNLAKNLNNALEIIRGIAEAYCLTAPVKLIVFPEYMCGWEGDTAKEMRESGIEIPGPETDKLVKLAKELDLYIVPGSWIERDPDYGLPFNTAFLVGPQGVLIKYRKINVFSPCDQELSPHDLLTAGYDLKKNPLFPVAKTEIGNIGLAICYDMVFPEVARQLAYNGAEILVGCSGWFNPYGSQILDWWNTCTKARSIENLCYGVYMGSSASFSQQPPFSASGYSTIVDFEGRVLAKMGEGTAHTFALFNIDMLRHYRKTSRQNNMLAQNREEAYDYWKIPKRKMYPELAKKDDMSKAEQEELECESFEEFYSKYYSEEVRFPRLGEEWWKKF